MTIYSRDNTVVDATRCAHKRESSQSTSFTAVMHSPSSFLTHPSNALFPFLRATSNVHGILNQGSCSAPPTEIKQGCTKAGKKSCRPPPPFLTHPPSCAHPFPPSGRRSTARAAAARREWEKAGGKACETWRGRPAPLSGDPSTGCGVLTEEGEVVRVCRAALFPPSAVHKPRPHRLSTLSGWASPHPAGATRHRQPQIWGRCSFFSSIFNSFSQLLCNLV